MRNAVAFITLSVVSATALQAHASTVTVQNTTDVVAYSDGSSGSPTDYYGNSAVGSTSIGSNFETSSLAYTTTLLANGNYSVDLQYTTLFSGSETLNNQQIYYPDIFLRTPDSGYSNAPFDYAISLGDETKNGGLAAGFYAISGASNYLTSQQVWSGRSGFVYGGQYTNTTAYQPGAAGYVGYNAPVVLTSGTKLGAAAITTGTAGSAYTVSAQITLTAAEAAGFVDGADIFWGTGDCDNGAFLADFAPAGGGGPTGVVPEPAALLLVGVGLGCIGLVRRKQAFG